MHSKQNTSDSSYTRRISRPVFTIIVSLIASRAFVLVECKSSESVSYSDSREDDFDDSPGASSTENDSEQTQEPERDFRTAALALMNFYRTNHGSPGLILDPALNIKAQLWADNLTASNTLDYSCSPPTIDIKPCKYTESIALVEPNENQAAAARSAVRSWYKQGIKYSYQYGVLSPPPTIGENVRDFTAMLWKKSKKVGFGLSTNSNGELVFVANYMPGGNIPGLYGKNVLP